MKRVTTFVLSCALTASAFAGSAPQLASTTTTTTRNRSTRRKVVAQPVTASDVQALKDALAAQQQQIQQLQQQVQQRQAEYERAQQQAQEAVQQAQAAASDAQAKAPSYEASATQQKSSVEKLSTDVADLKMNSANAAVTVQDDQKRMSSLEGALGRFRFSGDVRVRGENFFQNYAGCSRCLDRNRARVRARFGFEGKLSEDFVGGIALATGTLGDPTTTNTTLTNFFDRHTIGLDRAYVAYNPASHKWLAITGGKFAYTWQRTSVTFDPDLNPEGFSEKLSFDLNSPVLKNFTVQAMQLVYNENNSTSFLRAHDSWAYGGQVSGKIVVGRLTSTPSISVLNWRNTEALFNAS
jgi:hypothetical protein